MPRCLRPRLGDPEDLDLPPWRQPRAGVAWGCGDPSCDSCYQDDPDYDPDMDDGRDMTSPYEP